MIIIFGFVLDLIVCPFSNIMGEGEGEGGWGRGWETGMGNCLKPVPKS